MYIHSLTASDFHTESKFLCLRTTFCEAEACLMLPQARVTVHQDWQLATMGSCGFFPSSDTKKNVTQESSFKH